ncbi:DsbA family oxidoreductase [Dokdonia sinensis]|uniref:DsbA family oxidoreductase n=1 Tax=Dokdonia sinensis TaxID=2479847 RepID=A0A3M0GIQ3_9FLAO|nr:DsbA family oxidoreductase [Dokdonia sinensis]RMB60989.1 DsbA family oxidoreductase [Dokdonia sinensis]
MELKKMNSPIKIDIVSDVACPWCYVGKRRLEKALELWDGTPVTVEWHPYQLDPTMPAAGKTRDTYLVDKFGSIDGMKTMTDRLEEAGKTVGIDFNFGKDWLAVNTLPLHKMLLVAGQEGFKDALKERFLKAYFVTLEPLNDVKVLEHIGAEFGWDAEKVQTIIEDQELAKAVQQEIAHYQKLGVTGVPFFILNNKYGISGAQPPEVLLDALNQLSKEMEMEDSPTGEACGIDDENC